MGSRMRLRRFMMGMSGSGKKKINPCKKCGPKDIKTETLNCESPKYYMLCEDSCRCSPTSL